jgi:hypothetical protein
VRGKFWWKKWGYDFEIPSARHNERAFTCTTTSQGYTFLARTSTYKLQVHIHTFTQLCSSHPIHLLPQCLSLVSSALIFVFRILDAFPQASSCRFVYLIRVDVKSLSLLCPEVPILFTIDKFYAFLQRSCDGITVA